MLSKITNTMREETLRGGYSERILSDLSIVYVKRTGGKYHDLYRWFKVSPEGDSESITSDVAELLLQESVPN